MKIQWTIISLLVLFNSNALQAQPDIDCSLTGRDDLVPVWANGIGERFPSAEAICRSVVPIFPENESYLNHLRSLFSIRTGVWL